MPNVLPRSLSGWPHTSLHLLEEGNNHLIVRFAYLCHMIGEELFFFPSCTSIFLSLVKKSLSTTDLWLPITNLICSNSYIRAAALSALMTLLCYSFASTSFTLRNSSSLSVDRLNSKIYTICISSLIANPSSRLPQK